MGLALAGLLVALLTPPTPSFDPSLSWYTLETGNFSVHFSCRGRPTAEAESLARAIGAICEEVREAVRHGTGSVVRGRTDVIVADFHDYYNGWAVPFPHNCMTVIPTPPAADRTNSDDWLRTVILHEYSHLLQMGMTRGPAALLRRVFGRLVLPNALLPAWLTEGYAVYNETRFSGFGRLRSPEFDMYLRRAARSRALLPLDRCSGYDLQRYPAGNASYLFGSRFFGHLARGDSGVWDRFNESHAGLLPFLENAHALKVVDRPFVPLWKEWQRSLAARADSADRRPASESLALLRRLTREGFDTGSPLWSKTGAEVYYLSRSGAEYPAIKKAAWDGSYVRVLHRGLVTGSLSLSPDGTRLAFSEYEVVRNGCVRTDIHSLDLATRAVRRLTNGLRARDPDFAPDSSLLVFVVNHDAGNDVVLMDLETGERRTLAESPDRTSFHTPRFSPGGRWVAVGVSRPGGWSDIELIDRTTGWTLPITEDRANDLWPSWSRDGRFLFFVSDRTGVFNLYAHSVEDRQLYRCTSVDDGVFEPAVGPGMRRVALIAHTAEGSDVHLLEIVPGTWAPAEPFADTMPELTPSPAPVGGRLYYYNPSPSVWPGFWLPWLAASGSSWEAGAFTLGWDVLQLHSYSGFAGYRAATRSPFLRIGYTCSRFRPAVSLSADVDGRLQLAAVGLDLPFYLTARSHWLTAALSAAHDSTFRTALAGSWTCSDAPVYRFCVAPTEGRTAGVAFDARARALAGACDRGRLTAFWARYFGAPRRTWSLRLLIAAGTAFGDSSADCAFALEPGPGRLAVRGFREAGPAGRHVAVAGVQLRVPLWWPERGISTLPLFLRNVNAAVFAEAGSVLSDSGAETRAGTGLELRVDLNVLHHVPVNIGFGAAAGLVPALSRQLYLRIESAMLSDLLTGKGPRRSLSPEPW